MVSETENQATELPVVQIPKSSRQDIASKSHIDTARRVKEPDRADRRVLHQELLEQLLGVRHSAAERSISEIIFSRCEYMNFSSVKCPKCGGAGVLGPATRRQQDEILARIAEWRESNPGAHHRGEALPKEYGCECGKCGGTGHIAITETEVSEWPRFVALEIEREGQLVRIHGEWVFDREATVRPGGEQPGGNTTEPAVAVGFAQASRVLNAVARRSLVNAVALIAHYGPAGDRWEKTSRYGRLFALFPVTDAGEKLLHRTRVRAGEDTPWGRIHSLMSLPNKDVVALVKQAYEQAATLLTKSADMWDMEVLRECGPR